MYRCITRHKRSQTYTHTYIQTLVQTHYCTLHVFLARPIIKFDLKPLIICGLSDYIWWDFDLLFSFLPLLHFRYNFIPYKRAHFDWCRSVWFHTSSKQIVFMVLNDINAETKHFLKYRVCIKFKRVFSYLTPLCH